MRVVIAGGSGFLGRALTTRLLERGDQVQVLTRRASEPLHLAWSPTDPGGPWTSALADADAVVNLAGEPVDRGRWTPARKAQLTDSRVVPTRALVAALDQTRSSAALLNASAVGFYGSRGEETLTEQAGPGTDFLATLCQAWEAEALRAASARRVVLLRTGLVLDARSGALARLLLPFSLGAGGPMGDGRQYWPWIHREDWVRLVLKALDDARLAGPLNLTAPTPVPNREFARALGRALHRPAVIPTPAFALRLALGEMADAMVLGGQRAVPARAGELGFSFAYPDLGQALTELLRGR